MLCCQRCTWVFDEVPAVMTCGVEDEEEDDEGEEDKDDDEDEDEEDEDEEEGEDEDEVGGRKRSRLKSRTWGTRSVCTARFPISS